MSGEAVRIDGLPPGRQINLCRADPRRILDGRREHLALSRKRDQASHGSHRFSVSHAARPCALSVLCGRLLLIDGGWRRGYAVKMLNGQRRAPAGMNRAARGQLKRSGVLLPDSRQA